MKIWSVEIPESDAVLGWLGAINSNTIGFLIFLERESIAGKRRWERVERTREG